MTTNEIRRRFLDFFKSKGHRIVASDTLAPKNDPSVLFTSAGMNQFKEQFMGKVTDFRTAATSQKCLRTGDLEKVGHTPSHHTFFEMLGNFSFGDYFKKEAIAWAWEFLTKDLKISPDKLWVSVYEEDDEAYQIWLADIKVPKEKIYKFGQKENFWPANAIKDGPNGPCGSCSEIFFDWGKNAGCGRPECSPACDCGRFIEIWNLVFTQFNRKDGGKLDPLPSKNIDTGMGLERMVACMQGVKTNFEIDIFAPIINEIRKLLGIKPDESTQKVNCIADHIRAVSFAIGDGILPSNEGRGYVIRKLIRRASWFAQETGFNKPFLYKLVSRVCDLMKEPYPELVDRRENIAGIILSEEERFINSLKDGFNFLEQEMSKLKKQNKNEIPGEVIFKLYDTFGLPVEYTASNAKANGFSLQLAGFQEEMEKQKQKAREGSAMSSDIFSKDILEILPSQFVGYETTKEQGQVIQIIKSKQNINGIKAGDEAWVVLDKTPFYGESGGQIGDTGKIISANKKTTLEVLDTKLIDNSIVHIIRVEKGELKVKDKVIAEVDSQRRQAIRRSHTCTHLLQASLRKVLGQHVQQSGSLVEPDRFRFDFTHFKDIKDDELNRIQDLINEYIISNNKVNVEISDKDKALKSGAIALFSEKYAEKVRVISIDDYSKEFCGGTHLDYTGNIGIMLIESESSIGSGLRRIQAYTGKLAYEKLKNNLQSMQKEIELGKDREKELEKKVISKTGTNLRHEVAKIIETKKETVNEKYFYIVYQFESKDLDKNQLRTASDLVMNELGEQSVAFLASDTGLFISRSSQDLKNEVSASNLLTEILKPFGGTGGGRSDFAQGGLKDTKKIKQVLEKAQETIKRKLSK